MRGASLETGVLDKQYMPLLMRPAVRYAARFPVRAADPPSSRR